MPVKLGSLALKNEHTPTLFERWGSRSVKGGKLRTCTSGGGSGSFLRSLCGCRSLTAPLGLRRRGRSFADEFSRHHAGNKQLGTMIIEINGGAFLIRCGDDSQTVDLMLDCLTFLHCLHNVLLDN